MRYGGVLGRVLSAMLCSGVFDELLVQDAQIGSVRLSALLNERGGHKGLIEIAEA